MSARCFQAGRGRLPVRGGVLAVLAVAGAIDESLVLAEGHPGVLGVGVRGEQRPHQRSSPASMRANRRSRSSRRVASWRLRRVGIDPAERTGVDVSPDRDERVHEIDLGSLERRHPLDLLVRAFLEEDLGKPVDGDARIGVRTVSERGAVEGDHEREGDGAAVEPDQVTGAQAERVPRDEVCEPLDAHVLHPSGSTRERRPALARARRRPAGPHRSAPGRRRRGRSLPLLPAPPAGRPRRRGSSCSGPHRRR